MHAAMLEGDCRLAYLYTGSNNVADDLDFYCGQLGGQLVWRAEAFGTEVAAVRLGEGPLLLLADHEAAPGIICIWTTEDLDEAVARLQAAGWSGEDKRVEVPDGTCLLLSDPSGNRVGLLHQTRPDAMERHRAASSIE